MRILMALIGYLLIIVICVCIVRFRNNRNKRTEKPYWEGKNTRRILRLVQKESDQRTLARIAKHAEDGQVRMAALERITDDAWLAEVAHYSRSETAAAAVRRITDVRVLQDLLVGRFCLSRNTMEYKTALECLPDSLCADTILKNPTLTDTLLPRVTAESDLKKIAMCGDLPGTVRAMAWRRLGCEGEADRAILCDTKLPADQRRAAGDRILALGEDETRAAVRKLVNRGTALKSVGIDFIEEAVQKDPSLLREFWSGMQAEAHEDTTSKHADEDTNYSNDCSHWDTPAEHTDYAHEEKLARFRPYLNE